MSYRENGIKGKRTQSYKGNCARSCDGLLNKEFELYLLSRLCGSSKCKLGKEGAGIKN